MPGVRGAKCCVFLALFKWLCWWSFRYCVPCSFFLVRLILLHSYVALYEHRCDKVGVNDFWTEEAVRGGRMASSTPCGSTTVSPIWYGWMRSTLLTVVMVSTKPSAKAKWSSKWYFLRWTLQTWEKGSISKRKKKKKRHPFCNNFVGLLYNFKHWTNITPNMAGLM